MVYELEQVLQVCDGFSATFDGAVLGVAVVAQTSNSVGASYFDRKPMKRFWMCGYIR